MNLYGLSAISNVNRAKRQIGTGGFLASSTGGGGGGSVGANPYFDYSASAYRGGLEPGGMMRASPSQTGQPRSVYGVEFPVVGYPQTGWDPNQRLDQYQGSIPGVGMPLRGEIGGGSTTGGGYSSGITPYDPLDYGPNPPPNEDVMPTPINTFYGGTDFNRRYPVPGLGGLPSGDWRNSALGLDSELSPISEWPRAGSVYGHTPAGYADMSAAPPVTVSPPGGFYPIPGLGVGSPSGDWRQNATWQGFPRTGGSSSSGSGYGSGRFAGPSVSFGYGGTMIGSTSGSIFGGNPSHGTILGY